MKIKDLIELLNQLPSEAEVRIYKDVSNPMAFEAKYKMSKLEKDDIDFLESCNVLNIGC